MSNTNVRKYSDGPAKTETAILEGQRKSVDAGEGIQRQGTIPEEEANLFRQKVKKRPKWKVKIDNALDHYVVVIFMTLVTIYALFFDDLRIIFFPKS